MTDPARTPDLWPDSPWADDEPLDNDASASGQTPAASPALLRASLMLLIASTIFIFLSAVASSNAAASSPLEQIALIVHRISMFAMLLGFVGILAAYRLPMVTAYVESRKRDGSAADGKPRVLTPSLRFLMTASALLILWIWGTMYLDDPFLHRLTYWILLVSAGLLANMAVLHRGCVRSFAIGTLVTMLLVLLTWRPMLTTFMLDQFGFGLGARVPYNTFLVSFGIEVTLSVISGLLCAFYCNFVMRVRAQAEQPPATSD